MYEHSIRKVYNITAINIVGNIQLFSYKYVITASDQHIFISYQHANKEMAHRVKDQLKVNI